MSEQKGNELLKALGALAFIVVAVLGFRYLPALLLVVILLSLLLARTLSKPISELIRGDREEPGKGA